MDILPSGSIFRELQDIYDTGYFSSQSTIEAQWNQVRSSFKSVIVHSSEAYGKSIKYAEYALVMLFAHAELSAGRNGQAGGQECMQVVVCQNVCGGWGPI